MPARDYQLETKQRTIDYFVKCAAENRVPEGLICLPTGTGKGYCIGDLCDSILKQWPGQRIIVATHVKELVQQNYDELVGMWPSAPAGILSAGLKRKDLKQHVTFAGIASLVNQTENIEAPDIFLIDEAHLLSPKSGTNYQKVIKAFRLRKPKMIVLGYTATHWRTGQGLLTEGPDALFKDIIIDLTTMQAWDRFLAEGYLLRPIPKRTKAQIDVSEVHVAATGDYVQTEVESAADQITYEACREIVDEAAGRKSWLIFAAGVKHAEHVAKTISSFGIEALAVHSKLEKGDRDVRIRRFKQYDLRCVVNNNVLTTGFNHPGLDFIGMLRPTMSVGLWVQMLGRGTRPYFPAGSDRNSVEGRLAAIASSHKQDVLVLDFAKNSERLGPINDPNIPHRKGKKSGGLAPCRLCEACGTYNHANASICIECGFVFERMPKIVPQASTTVLFKEAAPLVEEYTINEVNYYLHEKADSANSMKVEYGVQESLLRFTQYILFEHKGMPKNRAHEWWNQRSMEPPPETTIEALEIAREGKLRKPKSVRVWLNKKYPEIIGFGW